MLASSIALYALISLSSPPLAFLDAHDQVWEVAPARWLEGIPLANGDMGALIWGDGALLKITLDKYDAWETREKPLAGLTYASLREMVKQGQREEAEQCMRTEKIYGEDPRPTRLPMPRLEVDFGAALEWGQARLSLREAAASIEAKIDGAPLTATCRVDANANVLSLSLKGSPAESASFRVSLDHLDAGAADTLKRWGYPAPETSGDNRTGTFVQRTPAGMSYAIAWETRLQDDGALFLLSIQSSHDASDPLVAAKQALSAFDAQAQAAHAAWWTEFWSRSSLRIPDARLEALYYIEMYKLGCSSRPGKLPVTLQGLWTLDGGMPPWAGDYHLDMNVQQSYWPIYTANRLDLGEPLYRTFSACIPRWQQQCQEFFGFDGLWAGCAIGPRGERIYGYSGVELWPGNAAWLAHHYWLHFLYSQDKTFLREQALPMLRGCFLTYANLLEPGDDGKLHVPLSYSPEWGEGGFNAYTRDPNCDLALIRFLGDAILKSNTILDEEDALTPRVNEVLANLTPYVLEGKRLLVSAGTPLSHSHRHHSHLMAIHPLGMITLDGGEEDRAIIRDSLHEIRVKGLGEWTGWAYPWMSLIASRAGYGNTAWQMLDLYANAFIKPNTFHVNGDPRIFGMSLFDYEPMTLEAGFGASAAIMEMLLQSYNGRLRLFPTVPDRWHDASFQNLRAEGAFLVTARLEKGEVVGAIVTSEAGLPCEIVNPYGESKVTVTRLDANEPAQTVEGNIIRFDTQAGAKYLLVKDGSQATAGTLIAPDFERGELDQNFYGVKKQPRF
ncbi:MAG: glycoside hydrolase N-terminal domain-containing protein [Candidatus Hydrogenedentes bacterium]|nr:glycoside hydrolase N-terminal domain-containing protein [Candidatus Hydrogenedentota bacterium]